MKLYQISKRKYLEYNRRDTRTLWNRSYVSYNQPFGIRHLLRRLMSLSESSEAYSIKYISNKQMSINNIHKEYGNEIRCVCRNRFIKKRL